MEYTSKGNNPIKETCNIKLLSASELINLRTASKNIPSLEKSTRLVQKSNSKEETESLNNLYNHLEYLLSIEYIDRSNNRSQGIWDDELKLIKLTKIKGNFQLFGFVYKNVSFLRPYEGLFLMEMNNIQIFYESVIISLEQAYKMFLNPDISITVSQYIVYSKLMKLGFNLQKFNPNKTEKNTTIINKNNSNDDSLDDIWKWLFSNLNPPNPIIKSGYKNENIIKVIDEIKTKTISPTQIEYSSNNESDDDMSWNKKISVKKRSKQKYYYKKRSCSPEQSIPKKLCYEFPTEILEDKEIFNQISFIELKNTNKEDELLVKNLRNYKYDFDLYISCKNFRKTDNNQLPNYRVLIIDTEQDLPTSYEIQKLLASHNVKLPIIVIFLTPFFNFNGFIFNFNNK